MTELFPGIYKIESKIKPERIYIGSAFNIMKRWRIHKQDLNHNKHHSRKLQNHYNKYGKDDLVFDLLYICQREELIMAEQFFIDAYKPYFNICKIAGSSAGIKMSKESIEKNRAARIGKKLGPASEERKQKQREWNTGRKMTDEDKKKMSEARKGKAPWNKGTKGLYSEEYKQKLRDARKSFNHSPESKQKISQSNIGRVGWNKGIETPPDVREKISKALKGRSHPPVSDETKEKLRQYGLKQWQLREDKTAWNKGKKRVKVDGKYKFIDAD